MSNTTFELDKIYEKIEDIRDTIDQLKYLQRVRNLPFEEIEKNFELIFPRLNKILKYCGTCGEFHICLKLGQDSSPLGCPIYTN